MLYCGLDDRCAGSAPAVTVDFDSLDGASGGEHRANIEHVIPVRVSDKSNAETLAKEMFTINKTTCIAVEENPTIITLT